MKQSTLWNLIWFKQWVQWKQRQILWLGGKWSHPVSKWSHPVSKWSHPVSKRKFGPIYIKSKSNLARV